jgi:hypothetical protein
VTGAALLLGKARLAALLRAQARAVGVRTIAGGRLLTVEQQLAGIEVEVRSADTASRIGARFAIDAPDAPRPRASLGGAAHARYLVSFWIGPAADEGARVIGSDVHDGAVLPAERAGQRGIFTAGSAVRQAAAAEIVERLVSPRSHVDDRRDRKAACHA